MTRRILPLALPLLALAALGSAAVSIARANLPPAEAAPTPAGPVTIGALGRSEPKGGIRALAPDRAGIVAEVLVRAGARVRAGDALFQLDSRAALLAVDERRADLSAAEARLAQVRGQVPLLTADLARAEAELARARSQAADLAREVQLQSRLAARQAVAQRQTERLSASLAEARATETSAAAEVDRARAALDLGRGPDFEVAEAAATQARMRLDGALSDLSALTVRAREAGVILSVSARPGQAAGPDQVALQLAAEGDAVLRVYVEEADAPRVDPSASAQARLRGQPDRVLPLTYLGTEPLVSANRELSGRAGDLVDTRVVEMTYALPAGTALFGQTYDVTLPAVDKP